MSLSELGVFPPPTALPVSMISKASPVSDYYAPASGGGGGGGGANPVVSSLTVNPLGQITFANDNSLDAQGLEFNIDAAGTSTLNFGISYVNDETGAVAGISLGNVLITSTTATFQNLGANKLFLNNDYGANIPGAVIMNDPSAPGTAYVSSLRVSSINGAVPGGAISTFDSIRLNSISSIGSEVVIGQNLAVANAIACSVLSTVSITPLNSGNPVVISSLAVSTVNGAPLPIAQGLGYNVAPWQASGIIVGSQGIFSGVLNLGGSISGGGFASTLQLPPFIEFAATNNMTGNVVSGALASGALNDVAIQFPNTSSMSITATVAGNIGTLFVSVQGSANGFL